MKRLLCLTTLVVVVVAFLFVRHFLASDHAVLLCPDGPAKWIRADQPFDVAAKRNTSTSTQFAIQFDIADAHVAHMLEVTALRRVVIRLDGHALLDSGPDLSKWKRIYTVEIPRHTSLGSHLLLCIVSNENGPSLLRLKCPSLGIATDSRWQATADQREWKPAVPADQIWEPTVADAVDPHARDLLPLIPWTTGFFVIGLVAALYAYQSESVHRASGFRWLLVVGWIVLGLNNMFKIPLPCGYDAQAHYEYILYVADHLALPRPDAGWQFFQSPLYYILSAIFCRALLAAGLAHETILFLLRSIPLVCGGLMIELCYRAGRLVFPSRGDLQMITTVVGGFVPVNLYMAQTVSNEPMAAVISGLILLMTLRFVRQPQRVRMPKQLVLAGVLIGFAWITKVSTVLWVVPLGMVIAMGLFRARAIRIDWLRAGATTAVSVLLISGWVMIRNYELVGKPVILESSESQLQWWQDPGYRTPANLYEFGHVFARPIYNGIASVWDSLYGTMWGAGIPSGKAPWNMRFMWMGLWLGIVPCTAIFTGVIRSMFYPGDSNTRDSLRIAAVAVGCFLAAILFIYFRLPIFSCAKSSYMLGVTPCLGLLAAAGFDWLISKRWLQAVFAGAIVSWAMTSYLTYFAV